MRILLYSIFLLHSISVFGELDSCGISDKSSKDNFLEKFLRKFSISRILGGNEVHVGKWPWQVMLQLDSGKNTGKSLCGGSIISARWILTAAHCFDANKQVAYIIFGSVDASENGSNMTTYAKNVTIHKEYISEISKVEHDTTMPNDIALIELEEPLTFDDNVSPVCLPSISSTIPEDGQVIITGFGYANDRSDSDYVLPSRCLLESVIPLIPYDVCSKRWRELEVGGDNITESQLCAGSYGHGTGPGDSGGPLIINSKSGNWFQIGVTSFGLNEPEYLLQQDIAPGIYTNVQKYCEWIEENTRGEAKCREGELIDATTSATAMHAISFAIMFLSIINLL